ncbi:MAG: 2-oxo acid dehydrogenase subunit E2, partial [Acidimicrobiales bacterium]
MYEQYRKDASQLSESWREFFADYRLEEPDRGEAGINGPTADGPTANAPGVKGRTGAPSAVNSAGPDSIEKAQPGPSIQARQRAPSAPAPAAPLGTDIARPIRGVAARVVENMEASLGVPTATSVRRVPAKLLEVNRSRLNNHLALSSGGKVSFTHLIGFAVVRALMEVPAMRSSFQTDQSGAPEVLYHEHVGLGLAVDVEKSSGQRTLLVPCIKDADTLTFRDFLLVYEDLVRKVRANKVSPDDFTGVTATLTNPGTIGTEHSVPRLMSGQGVIVGVGALGYPAEMHAADPSVLARFGISKVIALTST